MKKITGLPTICVFLALLVGLIVYRFIVWPDDHAFHARLPLDLWIYAQAGAEVTAGTPLYDAAYVANLPFTYPPFSAILFAPLALFDATTLTWTWHILTGLALLAVLLLVFRERGIKLTPGVWLLAVLLVACSTALEPVHGTAFFGQINIFLMLLVSLDLLVGRRGLPGIGTGLAAGMKLTPAYFGLVFLMQRRWGAVVGCIATFLVTVAIGFVVIPDAMVFWTDAMFNSNRVGEHTNPGAQSIRSLLYRTVGTDSTAVWLILVAIVVALTCLALRTAIIRHNRSAAMALTGISACLVSPFSWYHHWVWVVPLAVVILIKTNRFLGARATTPLGRQLAGLGSVVAMCLTMAPFINHVVFRTLSFRNYYDISLNYFLPADFIFCGAGLLFIGVYAVWGFLPGARNSSISADVRETTSSQLPVSSKTAR
ncbi:Hypothetical protein NG00_01831 [Corynebacterium camporealensis]|uniref:Uncharacterized protein n=1 Tax=Corynebacterium camporealensis TaxID=161896 RepID=A0A0F6QXH3_9CORY|nr:glycosyltransferase 87 family protein [Corynebacterium camporealensis]AKE39977.1 Protein of unknown function (DUF2029) [Corynebacterium camporealensis]AVH89070.1 Hypothetical protein NG00_01831 [Corynebacterium camporealensis]